LKGDPLQTIFDGIDFTNDLIDADFQMMLPTDRLLERLDNAVDNEPVGWIRRRILRRTIVISTTTVLVLAGTAAAISLLRGPVRDVTRLSCFAKVSLTSCADVIAYTGHPLSGCQSLMHWSSVPASSSPSGSLCVLSNGSLAGFPPSRKGQACAVLELATFDGHVANLMIAAFEQSTQNYFTEHPCMTATVARQEVQRQLKKYGISGWRVQMSGSKSTAACADSRHPILSTAGRHSWICFRLNPLCPL
jgi:hypothetical protein